MNRHTIFTKVLGTVLGTSVAAWAQPATAPPEPGTEDAAGESAPDQPPKTNPEEKASSDDDVFDSLASDLEQGVESKSENGGGGSASASTGSAGGQSLNPDISVIADFAAAGFSDRANLQTGGHDPTDNGFNLQQVELSFSAPVDPYFRFDSHFVFGADGFELEEAYGTTLDLPGKLQARFGQFLTRFGRINASHLHAWEFVDQPFAVGRVFGGDGNRGLGSELSWLVPLPWYAEIVGSVTQADGEGTARSFLGGDNSGVNDLGDLLYIAALKQFFELSSNWSLLFGMSGAFGPSSAGPDARTEVYGTDWFLKYRPITRGGYTEVRWQTEVFYRRRHDPDGLLQDVNGYTQLAWRFAQRWATAARYEYGSPAFNRAGHASFDPLDPEWTDSRYRVAANLTHTPSEFSRLRLQGSSDLPGWRKDAIWAVFLAAEVVVGAHGAHPF